MTTVSEKLETLFEEREMPVTKKVLDNNIAAYFVDFGLSKEHVLRLEILTENNKEITDVQIVFRQVSQLTDYKKREAMLETLNELNEMRTGYYTLYLAGDGELYLRTLVRVHGTVESVYETLIQGPQIIQAILSDIEAVAGVYKNA